MSEPLGVLVVDDEPLARDLVKSLLAGDPEVTVVGACSGPQAVDEIAAKKPDILTSPTGVRVTVVVPTRLTNMPTPGAMTRLS